MVLFRLSLGFLKRGGKAKKSRGVEERERQPASVRLASILELTEVMSGPSELGLRTRIPIPDEFLARQSYIGKVKFSGDGHLNFNVHHAGRR
ncbi:hypothetical protein HO173_004486 [Letharia columbiana]|uniref:Uncharacterized protein n=1 Tax=Letharia columbiana TaxID=112416 RepID=A0A8H6FZ95_9LECA|nr:uncharacterized protein HO173_004486 [Letharia columbiana]KAF6237596.1 hypothetical protein HO173_004486 [Letharia columbiana]